jgi:DNA-binding response OmpR family regulator
MALRVLLVAGYRPLVKALTQGLEEEGFGVDHAPDTDVGYGKARAAAYDAIVLDLRGPGDEGLPLLRGWRRSGLRTPVLLLAAPGGLDSAHDLDPSADGRLSKPFVLEELVARLRALIRRTP